MTSRKKDKTMKKNLIVIVVLSLLLIPACRRGDRLSGRPSTKGSSS